MYLYEIEAFLFAAYLSEWPVWLKNFSTNFHESIKNLKISRKTLDANQQQTVNLKNRNKQNATV